MALVSPEIPWNTGNVGRTCLAAGAQLHLIEPLGFSLAARPVRRGQRVLLIDDVIATGGTAAATARLVRALGGEVIAACFLIELAFLEGRKALEGLPVEAVLRF